MGRSLLLLSAAVHASQLRGLRITEGQDAWVQSEEARLLDFSAMRGEHGVLPGSPDAPEAPETAVARTHRMLKEATARWHRVQRGHGPLFKKAAEPRRERGAARALAHRAAADHETAERRREDPIEALAHRLHADGAPAGTRTESPRCDLVKNLHSALGFFADLGIPVMLMYGTAIGFQRDRRQNCRDDDVDVAIFQEDLVLLGSTLEKQRKTILRSASDNGFRPLHEGWHVPDGPHQGWWRTFCKGDDPCDTLGPNGTEATILYQFETTAHHAPMHSALDFYVLQRDADGYTWDMTVRDAPDRGIDGDGGIRMPPASLAEMALPANIDFDGFQVPKGLELRIMPKSWLTQMYGDWSVYEKRTDYRLTVTEFVNLDNPELTMPTAAYAKISGA